MSIWLILTPVIAWAFAGSAGIILVRRSPERIWKGSWSPIASNPPPFDPQSRVQRGFIGFSKLLGWLLIAMPVFLTLMSLLVAAGLVSPAKN